MSKYMYVVSNLTLADYARLAILTVFSDVFWVVLNHSKLVVFFSTCTVVIRRVVIQYLNLMK